MNINARDVAAGALRLFDSIAAAGLLSDKARMVRNLIMTGQWGSVAQYADGINPVVLIMVRKIIRYANDFNLRDMKFGPESVCTRPKCFGVVRTTADNRRLCTKCWEYDNDEQPDPEPGKVVQLK